MDEKKNPRREELVRRYLLERQKEKRDCERSYSAFLRSAWNILEPDTEIVWNWHMDFLCEEVQKQITRIANKEPREYHLVINVPPSSAKSMIFTRMPNAWAWIHWPWMRFLTGSYSDAISLEHSVDTRTIIQSDWYQENWGDRFVMADDQNQKSFFQNNRRGRRYTTATGSKVTGRHAHVVGFDDPLNAEEAESEVYRATAIRFWRRTMRSRLIDPKVAMFWIIMQRLHEDDLTGWVLAHEGDKYKHICLPAEDCDWVSPKSCRRKYVNGLLFESRFSKTFLEDAKKDDPYMHAGQYMQRPSPEEGGDFKRQYWKFWKPAGMALPPHEVRIGTETYVCETVDLPDAFDDMVCTWDMAFKDKKENDNVSGHVVAVKGPAKFVIDEDYGKKNFAESTEAVVKLSKKFPRASGILIEDKANGPAIISELRQTIAGIIEIAADKSLYARAMPASKQQRAGNLYLPHPAICVWTNKFIDEFASFPHGAHDDRLASVCQAINYITGLKRVWSMYKSKPYNLRIGWKDLSSHSHLMCSQYVDTDLKTSCILALWNSRDMRLAIFDEFEVSTPLPEIVKMSLEMKITRDSAGVISSMGRFEWIGNALMFAKPTAATHHTTIRDGMADSYERAGVSLVENPLYDEYGAILLVGRLMGFKAIILDARCEELHRQCNSWSMDGPTPAKGFGMARALCGMVASLWESGKMEEHKAKLKPYSREKEQYIQQMDQAERAGRMEEFLKSGTVSIEEKVDTDSWMKG